MLKWRINWNQQDIKSSKLVSYSHVVPFPVPNPVWPSSWPWFRSRPTKILNSTTLSRSTSRPGRRSLETLESCNNTQRIANQNNYRGGNKGLHVVARNFFLLLLNCSAWPCLAKQTNLSNCSGAAGDRPHRAKWYCICIPYFRAL